ncbi:MAG: complement resistance protein TraT [Nitrospiraceae bacterium]
MRYLAGVLLLIGCLPGCAGNVKDTDLISSNTFFLQPSVQNRVFVQARNSSDNQAATLTDLGARLTAKGYQVVQDPDAANYLVLANIVYCNVTKPELPVEAMVAGGYGAGFGSSMMGGLNSLAGLASMAGPQGAMAGAAASMGLGAIEGIGSAVGSLFGGSSGRTSTDEIIYACVTDLQITDRDAAASGPAVDAGEPSGVYQTRLAASVHQKKMKEEEATLMLQQKLSSAVAGNF